MCILFLEFLHFKNSYFSYRVQCLKNSVDEWIQNPWLVSSFLKFLENTENAASPLPPLPLRMPNILVARFYNKISTLEPNGLK